MMLYYIILNYYIIYIYIYITYTYADIVYYLYLHIIYYVYYVYAHIDMHTPIHIAPCVCVSLRERKSTILSHDQQRIAAELSACRAPCQSFFVQDFECHNGSPSLGAFGHGQRGNISCFCIVSTVQ